MATKTRLKIFWLFILLVFALSSAQTERFVPDTSAARHLWHISDTTKLYVGASFYYKNPQDSIIVWLDTSDADTTGWLYFMVPGYMDSALALFTNRQHTVRNISQLVPNIPLGTEIFFMYKSTGRRYPRYTGQNRIGIDPRNQTAYPGAQFVSRDFGLKPGFGHRFSVAGRLRSSGASLNDTIVFGFEDGGRSVIPGFDSLVATDFDFNDVIFRAVGLDLNIEPIPDSVAIICADTVKAGDSLLCKAEVWSDSGGIKVRSPQFDSLVTWWSLSGRALLHDTLVPAVAKGSIIFLPKTAFERFTLRTRFLNIFSGDTVRSFKTVWVNPGPPRTLSIELRCDSASPNFSLHAVVPVDRVQIPSNTVSISLYAILRDRFGNFAGFSSSTKWDTVTGLKPPYKAGLVALMPGNSAKGEGIVMKIAGSGNTLISAESVPGSDILRDSVAINVVASDYDSLRVCVSRLDSLVPIKTCAMTMDQCTSFVALGRRVDNGQWERIETGWQVTPWRLNPSPIIDSIYYCPKDTGSGSISIDYQGRLNLTIPLKVAPGAPALIRFFTGTAFPFPADTVVNAGVPLKIFVRIFDKHDIWLTRVSTDQISWKLIEHSVLADTADSSGRLNGAFGAPVVYSPQRSPRMVIITAAYGILRDTLTVSIHHGKPYRISIEPSRNWELAPFPPAPIDTLAIPDDRTSETVWAVVRDSLGNFAELLPGGQWGASDTIVSIRPEEPGKGIVLKNIQVTQGACAFYVSQPAGALLSDTAIAQLLPYHYTALRITVGENVPLDSLIMSTNDDTTLKVQALRSDTAVWTAVSARWTISDTSVIAPASAQVFRFSPVTPGPGEVCAALVGTSKLVDTVFAIFTRGAPVHAEFSILTSDDKLIAGDTMRALIKIYNKDGLVPGAYCYGKGETSSSGSPGLPAYYQDSLGYGSGEFMPVVFSTQGAVEIAAPPSLGAGLPQCFHDGVDTVGCILYYAPFAKDSLHRLAVKLGDISADAAPFHLKPSVLARLNLVHSNYCCKDTLVLRYPHERALVYAIGRDRYGNITGEEKCSWTTSGTLHSLGEQLSASRIIYRADSQSVTRDEEGAIIATADSNTSIVDSLRTLIVGPQAEVVSAITQDSDGDGMLDRIVVRFSKPIFIRNPEFFRLFDASYLSATLQIDSASIADDSVDVSLYLKTQSGALLQTDWTPFLLFHNTGFALGGASDSFSRQVDDGAGPVIESVVKEIHGDDHRRDQVTVVFSEPVTDKSGNTVSFLISPDSLFCAWYLTSSGTFDEIAMFDKINALVAPTEPGRIRFLMANGMELVASHYLNFKVDDRATPVFDKAGNRPSPLNRKVKVKVIGEPPGALTIGPNPSAPTVLRERPGEFHVEYNPEALNWVAKDHAGFAIKFQIVLPEGSAPLVDGRLNIYDNVGNNVVGDPVIHYVWKNIVKGRHVITNENHSDLLPSFWTSNGTVYDYFIYWNGYSKKGIKTAPGVYKAILTLNTVLNGRNETKILTGLIGVTR
jgi:hypothetical protein